MTKNKVPNKKIGNRAYLVLIASPVAKPARSELITIDLSELL